MEIVATAKTMSEDSGIPAAELIDRFFFYANSRPEPVKPLTIVPDEPKVSRPAEYTALNTTDLDD